MSGLIVFLILSLFNAVKQSNGSSYTHTFTNELHQEGKRQFDIVSEKSKLPQYGSCWKEAVSQLSTGCKYLNENLQAKLALSFTDCFLQNSGHETLTCRSKSCIHQLSDKQFNAYTEFYTHTQSMCYFLQSQVWHEEAEKTIDKLTSTSVQVASQLEAAEATQELLLKGQKESISMQHELTKIGLNLADTLQKSKNEMSNIVSEFRSVTNEQKQLLFDVFNTLSSFKSWAISEVSLVDTILFYLVSSIGCFIVTSTSRTLSARLTLFVLLIVNLMIERFISSALDDNYRDINIVTETIDKYVWLSRKVTIICCSLLILVTACRYQDINIANYHLLLEIKKQNMTLIELVENLVNKKSTFKIEMKDTDSEHEEINSLSATLTSQTDRHSVSQVKQIDTHVSDIPRVSGSPMVNVTNETNPPIPVFNRFSREFSPSQLSTISESSTQSNVSKSRYNLRRTTKHFDS